MQLFRGPFQCTPFWSATATPTGRRVHKHELLRRAQWASDHAESLCVCSTLQVQIITTTSTMPFRHLKKLKFFHSLDDCERRGVPLRAMFRNWKLSNSCDACVHQSSVVYCSGSSATMITVLVEFKSGFLRDSRGWKKGWCRQDKRCTDMHVLVLIVKNKDRDVAAGGRHCGRNTVRVQWNQSTQCLHSVISVLECETLHW